MKQLTCALALTALVAGTLWAKDDPFCGKWKLNKQKSKVTGEQMIIEDLGNEDLGNHKLKFITGVDTDTVILKLVGLSYVSAIVSP